MRYNYQPATRLDLSLSSLPDEGDEEPKARQKKSSYVLVKI
jgi:hypothetical protein